MSASTQDKKDDEFEQPMFENGLYGNPKSFTNWTGLPGLRAILRKIRENKRSNIPSEKELEETLPVHKPIFNPEAKLEATWIGHATVVVTLEGATFLTDPIWSNRCSPLSFVGPKRYRPPPCSIEDLPKVDFIVISHNHYDHLDKHTVQKLEQLFGGLDGKLRWLVPLGLKSWMESVGCHRVQELTWGEKTTIAIGKKNFDVYCLPAQHWSARGPFDRWKSLWSSWAVVGPTHRFYFAGDTGHCEAEFGKIGRKLGPFDLAAIPIGCSEPKYFVSAQHIGPEEAVEVHRLIRSKNSIGIHWGTFHMVSGEPYLEPSEKLEELVKNAGLAGGKFKTIHHGKTTDFSTDL